jgi:hypothetical protein
MKGKSLNSRKIVKKTFTTHEGKENNLKFEKYFDFFKMDIFERKKCPKKNNADIFVKKHHL